MCSSDLLILTIGGIAKGTTSSGAYSGWMNHKKTAQPQAESFDNLDEVVDRALEKLHAKK